MQIALVGNPNCGKTTLFNFVTKNNERVGNWPGVTVEKKIGNFKKNSKVKIIDLPGIYSLTPFSPDENVTADFLINNKPDAIINVVSAVNLERSLYLTLQLIELNIPMIIAVTMTDLLEKNKDFLNLEKFSQTFNCKVFPILKNDSFNKFTLIEIMMETATKNSTSNNNLTYQSSFEDMLKPLINFLKSELTTTQKLNTEHLNLRWIALGLFEKNNNIIKPLNLTQQQKESLNDIIKATEKKLKESTQNAVIHERYYFISTNIPNFFKSNPKTMSTSDKIDRILTNKWLAIPIFIFVIALIYFISIPLIGKPVSDWLNDTILKDKILPSTSQFLTNLNVQNWLVELTCNGIIAGVGSVLIFVPQLFILFLILSFLEDCGYMSRVAFITDKILSKFGLCGQSIISYLVSSSCGVNGIMATKTIKNNSTRLITLTTTTFVPCSAKIPIIATIGSLFFSHSWVIAPLAYLICFLAIFLCAFILKKSKKFTSQSDQFFMEMAPYQLPSIKNLFYNTLINIKSFVVKAGTVVLLASVIVWIASNFGIDDGKFAMVNTENSFLASLGKLMAPCFSLLGFSNWKAATATISGILAKENVVNTLEVITASSTSMFNQTSGVITSIFPNQAASLSFLTFNLLCAPCCIAIAAIFKQTASIKLTIKIILIQTLIAYFTSAIVFTISHFFI